MPTDSLGPPRAAPMSASRALPVAGRLHVRGGDAEPDLDPGAAAFGALDGQRSRPTVLARSPAIARPRPEPPAGSGLASIEALGDLRLFLESDAGSAILHRHERPPFRDARSAARSLRARTSWRSRAGCRGSGRRRSGSPGPSPARRRRTGSSSGSRLAPSSVRPRACGGVQFDLGRTCPPRAFAPSPAADPRWLGQPIDLLVGGREVVRHLGGVRSARSPTRAGASSR